jgi:glycosyltransferase involved in cell wall biosynthesis
VSIRVCMVAYSLPPFYSGAGTQALRLAQTLVEKGIHVSALTARHTTDVPAQETVGGVTIHRLPVLRNRRLRHLSFFLVASWHLLCNHHRYDIVHLHGAYRRAIPIIAAARVTRLKTVVKMSMMGTDDPSTTREWRFGGLLMKALARADAVVAITEELAESYLQASLPSDQLVRIPNGVDTDLFHPVESASRKHLREMLELPLEVPIVLFVGIVHPRKGVDRLLEVWPAVQARHPRAILLLVGPLHSSSDAAPPGFVDKLHILADQHNIHPVGQQEKIQRFYQAADVFVLPSRMEGLPNALLEAMACGLPTIASPLPGVSEVIEHDSNGLLVSPDASAALPNAILHLLEHPGIAKRLGGAAHQTIMKRYSLGAVADRYVHLYNSLAETKG